MESHSYICLTSRCGCSRVQGSAGSYIIIYTPNNTIGCWCGAARGNRADIQAQALYSLSQDNRPFTSALLQHPTAVPSIVQAIEEDHSITEAELAKREAAKSKRKDKEANGNGNGAAVEEGIPDGRPLLMRVSLAGAFSCRGFQFDVIV